MKIMMRKIFVFETLFEVCKFVLEILEPTVENISVDCVFPLYIET